MPTNRTGGVMQSSLEREIREQAGRYAAGELSLRQFDAWFSPATADIEQINDQAAMDLTYEIMGRLAEYSYGHWTESDLRELFRLIAQPVSVHAGS